MIKYFLKKFIYRIRGQYTTEDLIKRGLKVGQNFNRLNDVIIDPAHCWLIKLGDDVTLAPRVHILAHDASTKQLIGYTKIGRVNIGNNVFIGADSIILPNVHIGDNCIIGANSTITKDVQSDSVIAGNPARYICTVNEYIKKNTIQMSASPVYDESFTIRKDVSDEKKKKMIHDLESTIGYID